MKVNSLMKPQILFFLLILIANGAFAGDAIYTGFFNNKAVGGYDTVAFFTESKAVKGNKKFQTEYQGADWYFSSQENLVLFRQDPEKYAPQYGGFCAWAVAAKHDRAPGNAKHWKIVDGKLYLNYDAGVQAQWLQDVPGFIAEADRYWPTLLAK